MATKAPLVGIRLKLSAAFTAVSLVIAGFVIGAINMQLQTIERAALLEAEQFAKVVAYASTDNALNKPEYLQSYVDGLHALHGRDLVFVDFNKKGIADADKAEIGAVFKHDPGDEVGQTIRDGRVRTFIERNELHPRGANQIVVPLRESQSNTGSAIIGAAIVEYTHIYDGLLAAELQNLYLLGASGIGCVLLSMIFGLRIAAKMARRLKSLQDAADTVAKGNYEANVSIVSRDEIGRLGMAFNAMAGALKGSRDELVEYGRTLEGRVASRTEDLTQANMQLRLEADERAKAEQRVQRLNRVYAVLSGINALIVRVHDRDQLLREACRIAVDHGKFHIAWIGLVNQDLTRLDLAALYGERPEYLETIRRLDWLGADESGNRPAVGRVLIEKRPVFSNDVQTDSQIRYANDVMAQGTRSLAVLPLMVADSVTAVLCLHARETGFFDDDEKRLLLELAGDISFALDHIEKEAKLEYLAYYDSVTGLANRTLFHERLEQGLAAAGREERKLALIILDIERFKTINDTLGRQAGDALLKQIADRMAKRSLDIAWLARIGGDHFAIMAPDIQNVDDFARLAEKRLEEFFGPLFRIGETELRIAAKLGIAMFPGDGADAETLFRNAEAALKKAKASGDRLLFYTQAMNERVAEKLALETKLRQALEKDEFVLHYQPKVDAETRRIVGVEALIRWQSPELGLVPPMKFIPLMEETGLILPVGTWALKRASLDHRRWVNQGMKAPRVAVNVSPIQLRQRDFVGIVEQAIMEGVSPTGVDLEITESLIMEDIQGNIEKLKAAGGLGMRIAIDDFGTGYSSLGYLAKLPVQTLKIDRSFIITMLNDPGAMTLVQTMISLAHSLRLQVVAEGVDAEDQAKTLRLLRCDEMQGYLFSKPVPFDEMTALLRREMTA
jgi:diguanylate cyclase (GGDEF)-like protein